MIAKPDRLFRQRAFVAALIDSGIEFGRSTIHTIRTPTAHGCIAGVKIVLLKQDRHAVMNRSREIISGRHNQRSARIVSPVSGSFRLRIG